MIIFYCQIICNYLNHSHLMFVDNKNKCKINTTVTAIYPIVKDVIPTSIFYIALKEI